MKKILATLAAVLTLFAAAQPAYAADPIKGQWYTKGKRALVTIISCGDKVCGNLTEMFEKPKDGVSTDVNNSDPKLRNRKLIGLPVLTGFTEDGTKWRGRIYDPESGNTYRSVVERLNPTTLKVEGCVAFICRKEIWTRAN